jgi:hypothetical protein
VRRDALDGTDIDVVFDAPTKDWAARRNAPTIDLFFYDIREDLARRQVGRIPSTDNGRVTARLEPPRWYKLSYLLTAWTQRPEDEQRLLARVLGCLLRYDRLPSEVLSGSLSGIRLPIFYTCALPPPEDRAFTDVWSAIGGELKPSLDLVVVAPFDLARSLPAGPPVRERLRLSLSEEEAASRARELEGTLPDEPFLHPAVEEMVAGTEESPGRRVQIREMQRRYPRR